MSDFSAHEALEQARERGEHARGNPTVAIAAALLAVLAALATMLAHSRSTTGLVEKNEAILAQAKASDRYNYYEAKQIKYHIYTGLVEAGVGAPSSRVKMVARADTENTKSKPILKQAQALELQAEDSEVHSESALKAYETFEIAVTLFEISIVFVSISALAGSQALIWLAGMSSGVGITFLILGLLKH